MAGIQAGINQLITTAGVFANLSPDLRALAEKRNNIGRLEKQAESIAKARDIAPNVVDKESYQNDLNAVKKQLFETDPSTARYEEYQKDLPKRVMETEADIDEIAQEIAESELREESIRERVNQLKKPYDPNEVMSKMAEKGKSQIEQRAKRRDFMKALGSESVNFGSGTEGTVSDLPKNLQKAIAAQYNKSQRKELMDKYYG